MKRKRASLGLTQADLAERLDVKSNTVSRYETGLLQIPRVVELALQTVERELMYPREASAGEKQTFAQAAAKYVGKYDFGPGDLATNKAHLEGLGRD